VHIWAADLAASYSSLRSDDFVVSRFIKLVFERVGGFAQVDRYSLAGYAVIY
jgi:CRISPR/Cas system-associated exonuclease Cas4 (RecB family)